MRRKAWLAALWAAALASARAAVASSPPVRIAVLGDSLALGTGASRADGGFIFPVFRELLARRPGSRIDDMAIGGATAADVLRLECPRLAAARYDVVIVCAGGNDVVHRTPAAEFARIYAHLIERTRVLAPRARIICCGVPDVGRSPIFAGEAGAVTQASSLLNGHVREAASAAGAAFVDLFALTRGARDAARLLSRDRFHPSDRGYALFARALEPLLESAAAPRPS